MYKLLLMAPDGEFVTEGHDLTFDEAGDLSEDMGSRWIFFPYHFIIKDYGNVDPHQRIIESNDEMPYLKGKSVMRVQKLFQEYFQNKY